MKKIKQTLLSTWGKIKDWAELLYVWVGVYAIQFYEWMKTKMHSFIGLYKKVGKKAPERESRNNKVVATTILILGVLAILAIFIIYPTIKTLMTGVGEVERNTALISFCTVIGALAILCLIPALKWGLKKGKERKEEKLAMGQPDIMKPNYSPYAFFKEYEKKSYGFGLSNFVTYSVTIMAIVTVLSPIIMFGLYVLWVVWTDLNP